VEHPLDQYVWDVRYAKAPVVRFHDGNTDGDYDGGTQEGDNTLYYTHDANWNTTAVVDQATGEVAERYYYDAYGQAHFADDSWTEIEWDDSLQNEVLYGGYAFEAESGLYHTDAREYHCTLGRFVQVDPLGLAAGPNVYAYCNDSPADTVDPSGLEPDWAKAATGIMMVALSAMQTQAAISLGGSVFGMLGVTAGYGGFAAGMAMIVSAFSPDPRLDQVAEAGAMIQLAASTPEFGASVIAAGGSMLRRAGAVLNGGVRSVNPTVSGRAGITEIPFKSGDIIVKELTTSKGPLEMAAETVIDGRTLHLKDIAVYPKGAGSLQLGPREVMALRSQLAAEAKAMGFERLRITGTRLTGANPGKTVDIAIELKELGK